MGVGLLDTVLVGALCMPIVLIGVLHAQFKRLYWRRFAPLIVGAAAARFGLSDPSEGAFLGSLAFALLFVALLYLAVARRHARQVGPVLTVLLGMVLAGFVVAFFWLSWRAVLRLSALNERKAIGDAQVQIASGLVMLTAIVPVAVLGVERETSRQWLPLMFGAALAAFLAYVLGIRRIRPWPQPQGLLLLRVFAQDERGEVLLDETAFRWRFVGPIHMIGGPDMAQQTLDPHELLLLLRGRAQEQFVTTRAQLIERLQTLDEAPDPDGRYRVSELFCLRNLWQPGVEALLGHCPAVLLDLRGFTARNAGTAFEIGMLARQHALGRRVCLVDDKTDLAAVERTIAATGQGALGEARVLRAGQGLDAPTLFAALAEAAAGRSGRPGAVGAVAAA